MSLSLPCSHPSLSQCAKGMMGRKAEGRRTAGPCCSCNLHSFSSCCACASIVDRAPLDAALEREEEGWRAARRLLVCAQDTDTHAHVRSSSTNE